MLPQTNRLSVVAILLATALACIPSSHPQWTAPPCPAPQPPAERAESCGIHGVVTIESTLVDEVRKRSIPVVVYAPDSDGAFPLLFFSHGLGNSHRGYRYLGHTWASHGYVAVHVGHVESSSAMLRQKRPLDLVSSLVDVEHWRERENDVRFALAALEAERVPPPLGAIPARIDFSRIGFAGHSFGAFTALGLIAERTGARRIAGIVISPPTILALSRRDLYDEVDVPILHMSGEKERSLFARLIADDPIPYDRIDAPHQYLVIVGGAVHGTFSDDEMPKRRRHDRQIALIQEVTTRFWNAWLKDDEADRAWLDAGRPARAAVARSVPPVTRDPQPATRNP